MYSLARKSLMNRQSYQKQAYDIKTELESQQIMIQELKRKLRVLESKGQEVKTKKNIYLARLRSATAKQKLNEILNDFEEDSSNNLFEIIDNKIMELSIQPEAISIKKEPNILESHSTKLESKNSQARLPHTKSNIENLD